LGILVAGVYYTKSWKVMEWHLYRWLCNRRTCNPTKLKIDTGCVVAYTAGIDYDIEDLWGIKNWMFGEGLSLLRFVWSKVKYGS
jgi:hypothetical protein